VSFIIVSIVLITKPKRGTTTTN